MTQEQFVEFLHRELMETEDEQAEEYLRDLIKEIEEKQWREDGEK